MAMREQYSLLLNAVRPKRTPPLLRRIPRHLRWSSELIPTENRICLPTCVSYDCPIEITCELLRHGYHRVIDRIPYSPRQKYEIIEAFLRENYYAYLLSATESGNLATVAWINMRFNHIGDKMMLVQLLIEYRDLMILRELGIEYMCDVYSLCHAGTFTRDGDPQALHWALKHYYIPPLHIARQIVARTDLDERWDEVKEFLAELIDLLGRIQQ